MAIKDDVLAAAREVAGDGYEAATLLTCQKVITLRAITPILKRKARQAALAELDTETKVSEAEATINSAQAERLKAEADADAAVEAALEKI